MTINFQDYIKLLRPKHWVKNLFVFTAIVFSNNTGRIDLWLKLILAFIVLCLASSVVYIINDILDRDNDKHNPKKLNRPIASGRITVFNASVYAFVIGISTFFLAILLNFKFFLIVLLYLCLMFFYSLYLKNKVIVDVFVIALGFVIRVLAGTIVISVIPSKWIILCVFFLATFLGFSKRRFEYISLNETMLKHRKVLEFYSVEFLDHMNIVAMCTVILFYTLYTIAPETVQRFNTQAMVYSSFFVVFGLFRYLFLVHKKLKGSPVETLYSDKQLILIVILWVLYCVFVIEFLPLLKVYFPVGV